MRDDAKASTAGSKRRWTGRKPALLLVSLAACVAALVVVVGPASGATTRFLVEVFGSSAQPSFPADRGMAVDQGSGDLHVIDSTTDTLARFNPDGTPSNFSALGTNVIDGEGSGDETAHGHLAFEANRQREQVAIDESGEATDGNIYVTQSSSDVIDIFNPAGEYLGQLSESTEAGAFGEPCGVAVDSEGTVYVGDRGDDRIHVYEPAANPPTDADNTTSFATLTDPCTLAVGTGATEGFLFAATSTGAQLSKLDAASGEVKYQLASGASTVSVDPGTGHVFVARNTGSGSSVDEYDASGASEASLVSSFKPGSTVEGIALNSASEQVYVARASTENVEVFGPAAVIPDVVTSPPASNTGTRATLAGTVNPDGVELDECFFEWGRSTSQGGEGIAENTTACAQTQAEIGSGTTPVPVEAEITGLVPQGAAYQYRLVATNPNGSVNGANQNFTTPSTVITQAASGVTPTEATLNGTVNPDTASISECVFEWGTEKDPLDQVQTLPETAPCVPGPGGITGTSPVAVEADLSGLHPGTTYLYRLKATYPTGPITGAQQTVQTTGPVIKAAWAEDVVFTEAILKTEINPEGLSTTYRIEYGETEAYGSETPELNVGSDTSFHELSRFLDDLKPGTTYHYRVVATNAIATNEGPDQTFTTYERPVQGTDCPNQEFRVGASANLPDCRAYEMVSPVEKKGGDVVAATASGEEYLPNLDQSSNSGNKITYSAYRAFAGAEAAPYTSQYIASRGASGWASQPISPPRGLTVKSFAPSPTTEFKAFSPDLSTAWVWHNADPPLTPNAVDRYINLYKRDNLDGAYEALTTVKPPNHSPSEFFALEFQGASRDGSHAIFVAPDALTPEAPTLGPDGTVLYEWFAGELRLVAVMPNGEPSMQRSAAGTRNSQPIFGVHQSVDHAISDDGSRIFWSANSSDSGPGRLYVRIDSETTVPVSESVSTQPAQFWTASADGSKAIFTANKAGSGANAVSDLYEFDVDTETPTLIAQKVHGVLGASDDASYIYLVSREALASGAMEGQPNLYLYHEGTMAFIAMLPSSEVDATAPHSVTPRPLHVFPYRHVARVTPDGRHAAFVSQAALTEYDNTDTATGEAAAEVYHYDADTGQLTCASCNPSGVRPTAEEVEVGDKAFLAAASIPGWKSQLYDGRVLSDDGNRLFFNSVDPLVPQDTNGVQDVYQWQAQGSRGCEKADGCVSMLSTGESTSDSEFVDASADGDDVFVRTESSIDPRDPGLVDVYDAKVEGGFPYTPRPLACVGDACQSTPEPPNDPTPASAGFRGAGNPSAVRNCGAQAMRAAKLSRRAKQARRSSARVSSRRRGKRLRRRSARFAKRAKRLSNSAKRCRRASRRAGR